MRAKDVMTVDVVTSAPDTPVPAVARLLLERHISAVPVVDAERRVLGMLSEGDLMRRAETGTERRRSWWLRLLAGADELAADYVKAHGVRAEEVMTPNVVTVTEDAPVSHIARLLEERRIKRVPVVRQGRLVGIVSRADLLRGLATASVPPEAPSSIDDRAIREKLLDVLRAQEWATTGYINAVVSGGVVHLWGMVRSPQERRALQVAAETVPGVRGVEDHLWEVPSSPWVLGE